MATNSSAKKAGWSSLTKTQQADWKKKNFDTSKNVTEAQIKKLRSAGTPDKAIAKYKNDPAMREALNRFYGKARVAKVAGTSTASTSAGPKAPSKHPVKNGYLKSGSTSTASNKPRYNNSNPLIPTAGSQSSGPANVTGAAKNGNFRIGDGKFGWDDAIMLASLAPVGKGLQVAKAGIAARKTKDAASAASAATRGRRRATASTTPSGRRRASADAPRPVVPKNGGTRRAPAKPTSGGRRRKTNRGD
jgi:hypothetical protein